MNGIHAAFTGRIGKDCRGPRSTRDDKPGLPSLLRWAPRPTDGEAPASGCGWRCSAMPCATAPRLNQGCRGDCEGRLSLGPWTGRDGGVKAGLNLAACERSSPSGRSDDGNPRPLRSRTP
jgi:hypothetical protein